MRRVIIAVVATLVSIVAVSCKEYTCALYDDYSVINTTDKEVALMVMIGGYNQGNSHFSENAEVDTILSPTSEYVGIHLTIITHPNDSVFEAFYLMQDDTPCDREDDQHTLFYRWGDGSMIFNLTDTTSIELLYQPYENPWLASTWDRDGLTYVNHYILTVTDSLLGLMEKDYTMLERFADYYGSAGR